MDDPVRPVPDTANFAPRCISVDLEVGATDARIHQFGAVRGDTDQAYVFHKGNLAKALAELDTFAEGATFLLGHNLVAFDLPHLAAAKPDMRLLKLPAVDTLRLNPLAFPRNPYHHLVKHYQDGQLKRGATWASACLHRTENCIRNISSRCRPSSMITPAPDSP